MAGQRLDVSAPFAQGRQLDRHNVEPVIEVFAEPPGSDQRLKIAVGGGDDAHVDGDFLVAAHPADPARLQGAEQAGLRLGRHIADFVEEQGAAAGLFEFADVAACGPGEGPLLVPEQLAFDQLTRDRRRVDRHEGPLAARSELVDRFGHQFLAGAAFTQDQYSQIVAQDAGDHAVDVLHRLASADQRQAIGRLGIVFLLDAMTIRRLARGAHQLVKIERLGEILEGPGIAGPDGGIERVLGRQDDHRHCRMRAGHLAQRFDPVTVQQDHVGQHHVIVVLGQQPVTFGNAIAAVDGEGLVLQRGGDDHGDGGIVLHQQRAPCHAWSPCLAIGRWMRKWVQPPASSRSCVIRPSMSRTSF